MSGTHSELVRVVGLGSPHGDDRVGWVAAERVEALALPGVRVETSADPLTATDCPEGCRLLLLVDACRGAGVPGSVHRFEWPEPRLDTMPTFSSHSIGLVDALRLAATLGRLPARTILFGVEVSATNTVATMSAPVEAVVPTVVARVLAEITDDGGTSMPEPVSPELLRGLAFLSPLTDDEASTLAAAATVECHPEGTVLFREGDTLRTVWVVVSGEVGIEVRGADRRPRRLQTVGAGELLGWSPVLARGYMTATARALTGVRLLALNADAVLGLCEADPRFGYQFMKRVAAAVASRLNATRLQLLDIFGPEVLAVPEGGAP
jgi:hydrogenase maturation protease